MAGAAYMLTDGLPLETAGRSSRAGHVGVSGPILHSLIVLPLTMMLSMMNTMMIACCLAHH
jgi:hypothetical protein